MPTLTTKAARWLCPLLLCSAHWVHAQTALTDAWRTVPLVDAHFHLMAFMTPADLLARMDQHSISHTMSAGAIGSPAIGHPNLRDSNAAPAITAAPPAAPAYPREMAGKQAQITFALPPELLDKVDHMAESLSISRAAFIKQALTRAVLAETSQ
jgi:hypothetical protein